MNLRRWSLLFAPLLISTLLPVGACAASLGEVHTVYLFPMAKGLDQYLANRLTQDHIFKVVTDPTAADAILTDKLGPSFEYALLHVRPELKPPPPPKKETEKKDDDSAKKDEPKKDDAPITSTFGAANGTVFLVDAKTRQVIWSTLEQPKHSGTKDVVKTATRIVKRLELDINPPVKK